MTDEKASWHVQVMPDEVLKYLNCKVGGFYVDATLGGGGHAEDILEATSPSGKLLGIDRDSAAIEFAKNRLKFFDNRVCIKHGVFSDIKKIMNEMGVSSADGMLLDLGVSSHQLNESLRGFSFKNDGPLDMRMDKTFGQDAAELINNIDEEELSNIIFKYGEERHARLIARRIVERRGKAPFLTTADLASFVASFFSSKMRGRIHPATRTFQALRIYINKELDELSLFLEIAPQLLNAGGRIVIISYHSLEDRLVKNSFRSWKGAGGFTVITKKIIVPQESEIEKNPRARSAKLRALERNAA